MNTKVRPVALRRSWLFVPGADDQALSRAVDSGADVLIQELEDFTPPQRRPHARAIAADIVGAWREAGVVTAIRINPLDGDGIADLEAAMAARPDVLALPKVAGAEHVAALDAGIGRLESKLGLAPGSTEILPNIESALGLVNLLSIAAASERVKACLLASEDLATDLGAERGRDSLELDYCRRRFLVECRAAGVEPVDCPYTWSRDDAMLIDDTRFARRLGYHARSCVHPPHAALINTVFTPGEEEVAMAQSLVSAFETARAAGQDRVEFRGALVEVPTYLNARRLLDRHASLDDTACTE